MPATAERLTSKLPRLAIYFDRGMTELEVGRLQQAESNLLQAARFDARYGDLFDGELRDRLEREAAAR